LIEHVPDDTFKYVAGPAATADGQSGSNAATYNIYADNLQSQTDHSSAAHLAKLGYTEAEIRDLKRYLKKADWDFLSNLDGTEEGYTRAFQTNPNDPSAGVTQIMSRYSASLLELDEKGNATQESCRQIELFTNAILKADNVYIFEAEDGTQQLTTDKYSDIYLERMYAGLAVETEGDAFMLAEMDQGTPGYEKLYMEYKAKYSMTSYLASQIMVLNEIKRRNSFSTGNTDVSLPRISNLRFEYGEALFCLSHAGGDRIENVKTELLKTGALVHDEWDLKTLRQLQEAKDTVWGYIILDALQGGVLLAAGIAAPPLAILVSLSAMALRGNAGSVTGLDSIVESKAAKIGLKTGNLVASELINGMMKWQKANQELDEKNYKQKMEFFGAGSSFIMKSSDPNNVYKDVSKVSFTGMYNPDVLRNMHIWETEGIKGWANLTDGECKEIIDRIARYNGIESQVYKDCYALMYGGYDIFGIGEAEIKDGIKNDMGRFMEAVVAFNHEDFEVRTNWNALNGGKKR